MNKAFVREQEAIDDRCPRCGSIGRSAGAEAVRAHVRPEAFGNISAGAYFCPLATCEVVYFDQFGRFVIESELARSVYPKDPDAPICGCFGLSREDIEQDVREGVATRCRAVLDRAKTAEARCETMSADGRSCVGEVQRYFMKLRASGQQ